MGIALWVGCAVVIFVTVRRAPPGRSPRWLGDLAAALASALLLGAIATAQDFGGWNEPDWRAGLLVAFGSAAVLGIIRLVRLLRAPTPHTPLPTPTLQR